MVLVFVYWLDSIWESFRALMFASDSTNKYSQNSVWLLLLKLQPNNGGKDFNKQNTVFVFASCTTNKQTGLPYQVNYGIATEYRWTEGYMKTFLQWNLEDKIMMYVSDMKLLAH